MRFEQACASALGNARGDRVVSLRLLESSKRLLQIAERAVDSAFPVGDHAGHHNTPRIFAELVAQHFRASGVT